MPYQQQKPKISRVEKQILGIFAVVGIASLIFGFLYFKENIRSPFRNFYTDYNQKTNEQQQTEELAALKTTDSDGDGLMDYDEIYQYNTSRFLADTDSDGKSDSEEVKNGTNPLCPVGKTCISVTTNTSSSNVNAEPLNVNSLTPDQLRELLRQYGMPENVLSQIDDSELLENYQIIAAESANANNNTNDAFSDLLLNNGNVNAITNINAAQIRQILINSGNFTADDLKNINDADLVQMYAEAQQE